ncbi:DUF4150 domain-containing protein [Azorhizobium doebereinerae]|uniref:DUF4150 domain-containing protein n=1 Tax=Azorhizobium doebereinerae TaxID=281091 RepID=UPI0004276579|nr:DUF4150 domain-containing protein [Azorhizobium doebereinerae]
MFVTSQGPMPATDMAFPDVCNTPVGPAVVPLPYPDIALSTTAIPNQTKLLLSAMPAHNLTTTTPLTNGDNAGVLLGAVSGLVMGPSQAAMGSANLFVGGVPATKLTAPTKQNGVSPNVPGVRISPSQIKLMAMQ